MANEEQLAILRQGVEVWNRWREENPYATINLKQADLRKANLVGADLRETILRRANLNKATLNEALLSRVDLTDATLSQADLSNTDISRAKLAGTNLTPSLAQGAIICRKHCATSNMYAKGIFCFIL